VLKKILIFVPVSDNCEALSWIKSFPKHPELDCSIILIHYGENSGFHNEFKDPRIRVIRDKSPSKFEKFKKYVDSKTICVEDYDAFWIADDDIRIKQIDLLKFFDVFFQHNLEIAQPGCLGYAMGKQIVRRDSRYTLRYSNYVDGMAPMFSRHALRKCLHTFEGSESGRGIDHVWAALLGNPLDKIAVIDESLMVHMKPSGKYYARFENSIQEQYGRIKQRYKTEVEKYYPWEGLVVYSSILNASPSPKNKLCREINNRLVEISQIGIYNLGKHLFSRGISIRKMKD
jgi:hypothetical protein